MSLIIEIAILLTMILTGLYLATQHYQHSNVVVLGTGVKAASVLRDLNLGDSLSRYNVLGFVRSNKDEDLISPKLRFNSESSLLKLAKRLKVRTVVVAVDQPVSSKWVQQLLDCKLSGVNIIDSSMLAHSHAQEIKSSAFTESALHTPTLT